MLDRLIRTKVEERPSRRLPLPPLKMKYRSSVAQVADRGDAFHVAAGDRLEGDGDPHQSDQFIRLPIAHPRDVRIPLARLPAQAARLAGGSGGHEEAYLQLPPVT